MGKKVDYFSPLTKHGKRQAKILSSFSKSSDNHCESSKKITVTPERLMEHKLWKGKAIFAVKKNVLASFDVLLTMTNVRAQFNRV